MNDSTREKLLKMALVAFGAIFFLIYPLGLVWPSGWVWHGGEGKYYLQMICGVYAVLVGVVEKGGSGTRNICGLRVSVDVVQEARSGL